MYVTPTGLQLDHSLQITVTLFSQRFHIFVEFFNENSRIFGAFDQLASWREPVATGKHFVDQFEERPVVGEEQLARVHSVVNTVPFFWS